MRKAKKLTRAERFEISILLDKHYSLRKIARALGRSPETISDEVTHNKTRRGYNPKRAHEKARLRLRFRRLQWRKIEENKECKQYVILKLKEHWNPDEIAGTMRKNKMLFYASKTAIYEWLRSGRGQRYCVYLYSKRYRPKKRKPKTKREMIPHRVSIDNRSGGAVNRTRYGHCEVDSVVSKKGTTGGVSVLQERKSRLYQGRKVATMSSKEHFRLQKEMAEEVHAKSVTGDNGIENKEHEKLGVPTFFCDPYSSWQKGGVENGNKMFRRYFPKGTNFELVTQKEIDCAIMKINNKPRKILGYRSALEVALSAGIIKNDSVLFQG